MACLGSPPGATRAPLRLEARPDVHRSVRLSCVGGS